MNSGEVVKVHTLEKSKVVRLVSTRYTRSAPIARMERSTEFWIEMRRSLFASDRTLNFSSVSYRSKNETPKTVPEVLIPI